MTHFISSSSVKFSVDVHGLMEGTWQLLKFERRLSDSRSGRNTVAVFCFHCGVKATFLHWKWVYLIENLITSGWNTWNPLIHFYFLIYTYCGIFSVKSIIKWPWMSFLFSQTSPHFMTKKGKEKTSVVVFMCYQGSRKSHVQLQQ